LGAKRSALGRGQPFRAREVNFEALNLRPIGLVVLVPHRLQANAVREPDDHCEGHLPGAVNPRLRSRTEMVESMRDQLRTALVRFGLREEEVRDLRDRNAHLELELQRQGRQLTNALKDNVVLKQQAKR